eukprot:403365863
MVKVQSVPKFSMQFFKLEPHKPDPIIIANMNESTFKKKNRINKQESEDSRRSSQLQIDDEAEHQDSFSTPQQSVIHHLIPLNKSSSSKKNLQFSFNYNSRSVASLLKLSKDQALEASQIRSRQRTFNLNLDKIAKHENKYSGNVYSMGIIKYDPRVYRDQKSQFMIISDQMSVLCDKIGQFIFHLNHRGDQKIKHFLEYVTHEQQTLYNKRFETMISMLIVIGKSVLQEFGETPQKIGIKNTDYILKKQNIVTNEIETFLDNFTILKEVNEVFKNCQSAYKIIQTNYDRDAEDPLRIKIIIDLLDKTRYFCGELLEKFKVIERNYNASKQRKKETDKARDDLFKSFLPTIDYKQYQRQQQFQNQRYRQGSQFDSMNEDQSQIIGGDNPNDVTTKNILHDLKQFSFHDNHERSRITQQSPLSMSINYQGGKAVGQHKTTIQNQSEIMVVNHTQNPNKAQQQTQDSTDSAQKLKVEGGSKKKQKKAGLQIQIKKETYEMIDKLLKRNICRASLQKVILSKKDTKLSTKDVLPDEVELLQEQGKEINMDVTRCTQIQKALKVGTGLCSSQIADNLYPLQRELGVQMHHLTKSIAEITKLKNLKMRVY